MQTCRRRGEEFLIINYRLNDAGSVCVLFPNPYLMVFHIKFYLRRQRAWQLICLIVRFAGRNIPSASTILLKYSAFLCAHSGTRRGNFESKILHPTRHSRNKLTNKNLKNSLIRRHKNFHPKTTRHP